MDQAQGIEAQEIDAMRQNCTSMLDAIGTTLSAQAASSAQQSPIVVCEQPRTGGRGRPMVQIDPIALQQLLELRGPENTAKILGCNTRTVRRRALDLGLVQPGAPVFTHETQPDGSVLKVYHRRKETHSADEEVYTAVDAVLRAYPEMGREKMIAAVKAEGVSATRRQVEAALLTLRGVSDPRKHRPIQRRVYTVPGSNYIWHHDGQHGMFFTRRNLHFSILH